MKMNSKLTGYDFWNEVLKSPQYVAAPMVDMSELSFRLLCRKYKAQLCFSPMLHSQQFLQDSLYRSDTFSTCPEDKPLVVQFCSNDPNDFIQAGLLVSSQCNAIDLNLGCPQAIARKGHYGAFLQDDWDLIHSIVRKAASDLPVPVTCKMRILPGDFKKSAQYAKMLEDSGCSIITVHGRTREQKGHATGLASWDVIKLIKQNVNIPVIANGNILSFSDISDCLEYTGADAVMSAEALLQNPALFSGKNPPVWNVVKNYLEYAKKYKTPVSIHQDNKIHEILAEGKTIDDFYAVCDLLKDLPKKCSNASRLIGNKDDTELKSTDYFSANSDNKKEDCSDIFTVNDLELIFGKEMNFNSELSVGACDLAQSPSQNINELIENRDKISQNLPVWLCHSRPRVVEEDKNTRGCYSKYFQSALQVTSFVKEPEEQCLSKKKLRKARHHERVLAAKKEKRKTQKMRRKQKLAELRQSQPNEKVDFEDKVKMTKKEKKMSIRERLMNAQGFAPKVCINLGFVSEMDNKELTRLATQLRRLYGSNRRSLSPLHLHFCSFSKCSDLYKICLEKNDGFSSYAIEMTEKSPEDLFEPKDLIYLSPDSENILTSLDHQKIYVIGGIVDGAVKKDLSLNYAKQFSIQTARLPITEYLVRCTQNPGTTVLTVNQVFDILLKYYETKDWVQALSSNVPTRKGYCAPSLASDASTTTTASKS